MLLIRPERTIKHDDPIAVDPQFNGILFCQLCPCGCRPYKTLSLPCEDVQLLYPLQHEVKVHVEAPDRRGVCTGKIPSVLGIILGRRFHKRVQGTLYIKMAADGNYLAARDLSLRYVAAHSQPSHCSHHLPPRSNRSHLESSARWGLAEFSMVRLIN